MEATIQGNRITTHVAPVSCATGADAIAAAAAVRARRKAVFYVAPAPKPAPLIQPIKAKESKSVPPRATDFLGLWAVMTAYSEAMGAQLASAVTISSIIATVCKVMEVDKRDLLS